MPSTFESALEGAIAAACVSALAEALHPAQTLLNAFREPQAADMNIQDALDHPQPCAAILVDLSKAFERVNPY